MTGPSAPRVVVAANAASFKKGGAAGAAGCVEGLCSLRSGDNSGSAAEGGGLPLRAMLIKSALRDWLSMSYGMISILLIGSLRSPPPIRLRRTFPHPGDRIKHLEASLRKRLHLSTKIGHETKKIRHKN